jgi:uncharacterized MAPEG superfamily protein
VTPNPIGSRRAPHCAPRCRRSHPGLRPFDTLGLHISPEDYAFTGKPAAALDEQIERIRRAHHNDLENVLPFLVAAFLLCLTGVSYTLAWWLFVPFTAARVLHTIFYAAGLQPWRTIAFEVGNVTLIVTAVVLLARAL